MNKLYILLLSIYLVSCVSSGKINYNFEMKHPTESKELFYENDTFSIAFDIKPDWIEFTLYNKLNDGIKISWDEVSISYNGKAQRVVHKETSMTGINDVQPPTTIPPRTKLVDALVMTDKVAYSTPYFGNSRVPYIKNTFPQFYYNKRDRAKALEQKGLKMTLFMPYYVAGKYVSMYYDLYLRDVTLTKG